jgi:Uma2 family endonuclease
MAQPGVASAPGASGDPERSPAAAGVPVLENGDRLTRYEFERRYAARPDLKKAQLIEGIVYMPSPVSLAHSGPHAMIQGLFFVYSAFTPGVRCEDNATVRLDHDNEPQPDVLLRIEPDAGGRCRVSGDDYLEGAPELVVEVAASSASIDLHDKLHAYRRNGVPEYIVWRTQEARIDWFELAEGEYRLLPADDAGVVHSRVFSGLRLAVAALLNGDLAGALAEVQRGAGTPEHQAFVARLAAKRSSA